MRRSVDIPFFEVEGLDTAKEVWAFDREMLTALPVFARPCFSCESDQFGELSKIVFADTAVVVVIRANESRARYLVKVGEKTPESVSIPEEWLGPYASGTAN